jgi:hypothetical protein
MRKIALLATAAAAMFGLVAVAYAANTYTVTVASVSPTKAGTPKDPKPITINFGYQVGTTDNTRPSTTTDYVIAFGNQIKQNRSLFKGNQVCTLAQAGVNSGQSPNCPATAKAGAGSVQNIAGLLANPAQKINCYLALTIYVGDGKAVDPSKNDGIPVKNDLVLALKGGANPDPAKACPLTVDAAIPAQFASTSNGTALKFHVRKSPFQEPSPGLENSVVNVTSSVGKNIKVKQKVKGKTKNVSRGLFESVGCKNGGHIVNVEFTPRSGPKVNATKKAPCKK